MVPEGDRADHGPMAPPPTSAAPTNPAPAPPAPPFGPDARHLRRSTSDRHLAGVAGGVAEHLGIDANLLRVALVVAGLFSAGFVLLAYLAAWVLLPDADHPEPPAHRWYREHGPAAEHPVATAIAVGIGIVVLASVSSTGWGWADGTPFPTVVAVAVLAGAVLVLHGRGTPSSPDDGTGSAPAPPAPPTHPAPPAPPEPDDATTSVVGPLGGAASDHGWATPDATTVVESGPTRTTPVTAPAEDRSRHRLIRNVVLLAALEAGAVTAALWATDTGPTPGWLVPASVLAVLLLGLAATPLWGWSWAVAALAVPTVAVLVLAVVPGVSLRGGLGERTHRPTAVADLHDRYRLGIGHHELDLTALDLAPGSTTVVRVATGIGATEVRVPADADLVLRGRLGGGHVLVDDEATGIEGTDVTLHGTYPARSSGSGGGSGSGSTSRSRPTTDRSAPATLVLDAEVGLGALEVDRRG